MRGSLQLRRYLYHRRTGAAREVACFMSDEFNADGRITMREAELHDEAERAGEYADIITDELPRPTTPPATKAAPEPTDQRASVNEVRGHGADIATSMAGPASPPAQENTMARAARKPKAEQVEQVIAPDFDLAVSIYRKDIKPAASKVGEHAQEMSEAFKAIKKRANIQPQAAKLAFKLDDMEESKRDDFLRSFKGLLVRLGIFMPSDLVDVAEGKGSVAEEVVPTAPSRRPQLATVPRHPADDSDLAGETAH